MTIDNERLDHATRALTECWRGAEPYHVCAAAPTPAVAAADRPEPSRARLRGMHRGDRVRHVKTGRLGTAEGFLQNGDVYVLWDDRSGQTIQWWLLELVPKAPAPDLRYLARKAAAACAEGTPLAEFFKAFAEATP